MDVIPYQFVRAAFLVVALASLVIAAFLFFRMRNKSSKWQKPHRIEAEAVVFAILLFFGLFSGMAFSGSLTYPLFMETMGSGGPSQVSAASAASFLKNTDRFERVEDIASPVSVPAAREGNESIHHNLTLTAYEVLAEVAPGITFTYWTFDKVVPGPVLRVREGDTVTVTLKNHESSIHVHSLDLHSVNGPHGGADVLQVAPGGSATFTFTATHPGVYVYHCAGGAATEGHHAHGHSAASHMAHGQYGLIIVDPKEGLSEVDHEFYVMQGEVYTTGRMGDRGLQSFDSKKMLAGNPTYVVFNGRLGGVQDMTVGVNDSVRLFVGNGGVNHISSFHVIGEIFDTVYPEAALRNPVYNTQTALVPAGGASVVEFVVDEPGEYVLVDHALARVEKGAFGTLRAEVIG